MVESRPCWAVPPPLLISPSAIAGGPWEAFPQPGPWAAERGMSSTSASASASVQLCSCAAVQQEQSGSWRAVPDRGIECPIVPPCVTVGQGVHSAQSAWRTTVAIRNATRPPTVENLRSASRWLRISDGSGLTVAAGGTRLASPRLDLQTLRRSTWSWNTS